MSLAAIEEMVLGSGADDSDLSFALFRLMLSKEVPKGQAPATLALLKRVLAALVARPLPSIPVLDLLLEGFRKPSVRGARADVIRAAMATFEAIAAAHGANEFVAARLLWSKGFAAWLPAQYGCATQLVIALQALPPREAPSAPTEARIITTRQLHALPPGSLVRVAMPQAEVNAQGVKVAATEDTADVAIAFPRVGQVLVAPPEAWLTACILFRPWATPCTKLSPGDALAALHCVTVPGVTSEELVAAADSYGVRGKGLQPARVVRALTNPVAVVVVNPVRV